MRWKRAVMAIVSLVGLILSLRPVGLGLPVTVTSCVLQH